ncbi:MAG: SnoaL-like domain-containing protein [Mucilaginibacter sp.]
MNTIEQIAHRMAELCREKKFMQAYDELYADESVAVLPPNLPAPYVKRLKTVIERIRQILSNVIIHKIEVSNPLFSGNYFALNFHVDFTLKHNSRKDVEELCVCHLKDGKITWQPRFMD